MKKTTNNCVGEDVEKMSPWTVLVGMCFDVITMENSMEIPQKIKSRTPIWSTYFTSEYLFDENGNINSEICALIEI